ncbi:FHY3/FAR1 [Gracilaria domingensis]|nr:FHY3/FAR1 [Gracilaria domingensis]
MQHANHIPRNVLSGKKLISRSRDLLENEDVMSAVLAFRRACPGGKGSILKLERFLADQFSRDEHDAINLVRYLQKRQQNGDVEYLDYRKDDDTGELSSIVWTVKGSKDLASRCGHIMFWDSTHNTTRAVLLSLTLHEDGPFCKRLLAYWHIAFERPLPGVIFIDGDEAIGLSLRSIPYDEEVRHLLCTYHLFDMQVKKRVNPILRSKGGASAWQEFRADLSLCSECVSESSLVRLWKHMLIKWFPPSPRTEDLRKYLDLYVWERRRHWASAYFKDSLTLGASSTQRLESWNSLVRCFADSTSLANYSSSILKLVERQKRAESKSICPEWRISPLRESPEYLKVHCAFFLSASLEFHVMHVPNYARR